MTCFWKCHMSKFSLNCFSFLDPNQPARHENAHSAKRTILLGRQCEHLSGITNSHYFYMTHPRCCTTLKDPWTNVKSRQEEKRQTILLTLCKIIFFRRGRHTMNSEEQSIALKCTFSMWAWNDLMKSLFITSWLQWHTSKNLLITQFESAQLITRNYWPFISSTGSPVCLDSVRWCQHWTGLESFWNPKWTVWFPPRVPVWEEYQRICVGAGTTSSGECGAQAGDSEPGSAVPESLGHTELHHHESDDHEPRR